MRKIKGHTHVDYKRLCFLWDAAEYCAVNKIQGAFVETGVWRGGCAGIMAHISKKYNYSNNLYFFDSFEGLPEPTAEDGPDAKVFSEFLTDTNRDKIPSDLPQSLKSTNKVKAEETYIKELLFDKLSINPQKVNIVKGWFQETLPEYKDKIGDIALLRLDGDWYESTKVSLNNLYDLVVKGGYVVIDDYYYWDGCKKAVDEFISARKLDVSIKRQDSSGAYFIKT